ncbi:hypothetical protein GBAR_LOCUS10428 [Geodia barretti]|uniref:Uncharacterized protein n=1 Tax=Geodia barretti TaxID=519541 RepID=A0AA35WE22_GEOBA|nr:hypothetical protein GBAR_LOCUS10428 [Geodia barretti]
MRMMMAKNLLSSFTSNRLFDQGRTLECGGMSLLSMYCCAWRNRTTRLECVLREWVASSLLLCEPTSTLAPTSICPPQLAAHLLFSL